MTENAPWDWTEPKRMRALRSIQEYIFWSYAMLHVSREAMVRLQKGEKNPYATGRTKAANILMSKYLSAELNMRSLERDDRLALDGERACAHCGNRNPPWHWDHLIPRSSLNGEVLPLNQVRSCPGCNMSRGPKDLMHWHRQQKTFPSLAVLRRYLKLCHDHAKSHGYSQRQVDGGLLKEIPFDTLALPRRFPALEDLIWDHSHPGR